MLEMPDFRTPEELEAIYETNQRFSEEPREQTLGRLAWMQTRNQAEFLLFLERLKVPIELVNPLMDALTELLAEYDEMVRMGLRDATEESPLDLKADYHPSDNSLDDLIFSTLQTLKSAALSRDPQYLERIEKIKQELELDDERPESDDIAQFLAEGEEQLETGEWSGMMATNFFTKAAELRDEALFDRLRKLQQNWPERED